MLTQFDPKFDDDLEARLIFTDSFMTSASFIIYDVSFNSCLTNKQTTRHQNSTLPDCSYQNLLRCFE